MNRLVLVSTAVLFATPALAQAPIDIGQAATLAAHNAARQSLGIKPLQWSSDLAQYAQDWANLVAAKDPYPPNSAAHRQSTFDNPLAPNNWAGENIYNSDYQADRGPEAVQAWISEKAWYNHDEDMGLASWIPPGPGCDAPINKACGHYTQVIWSNTQYVGCGGAHALDGTVYIVCNYYRAGNYKGQKPY